MTPEAQAKGARMARGASAAQLDGSGAVGAQASAGRTGGSERSERLARSDPRPLASSRLRLMAEAQRLEAALDRYRSWYRQRIAEEHALIAQVRSASEGAMSTLTAHRAKTAQGVQKADELSATLAGLRLQLAGGTSAKTCAALTP